MQAIKPESFPFVSDTPAKRPRGRPVGGSIPPEMREQYNIERKARQRESAARSKEKKKQELANAQALLR